MEELTKEETLKMYCEGQKFIGRKLIDNARKKSICNKYNLIERFKLYIMGVKLYHDWDNMCLSYHIYCNKILNGSEK